jgi:D-aminopeptidase
MKNQRRIRDHGIIIGTLPTGNRNSISDVDGVTVGHITLNTETVKTGVTALKPHRGNPFREKLMAAAHVINGFGKSIGLMQIEEMGTIETPIILTNTLSVGIACDALFEYMLQHNESIGLTAGTVNPLILECNDYYLNDIRGMHVKRDHILQALAQATADFDEGSVGAGTGMSCYELKGGIGSASRLCAIGQREYTVGVLVLTNMGKTKDLIINGKPAGRMIVDQESAEQAPDGGSIIVIIATDMPLSERQLKRAARHAAIGIARTGGYTESGSGEIAIAFSTSNRVSHDPSEEGTDFRTIHESTIDLLFRAVVECTEEAILNSLITAETTAGRGGTRRSLKEYASYW